MAQEIEKDKRYVLIELSCAETQCSPCIYPNCPRFVRESKTKKRPFKVKTTEIVGDGGRILMKTAKTKKGE
jgi:hypothetical protein